MAMDMNDKFQDRIDEYLLRGSKMSEEAKAQFLKETEEDAEKKGQYEFARNVKEALVSRGEKLKMMADFQEEMERPKSKRILLWISGIAAVLVVGFFAVNPRFVFESPNENVRGDDDVFYGVSPRDSIDNDSITTDTDSIASFYE